ncbi:transposable element Tcb1 transposase [Trichonephila clavipes]|nr:transposable element Tcb1 transposase [Trichonephila clavipes]
MVYVRLTSRHRRDHREWATEHVNWRRNEWSNVLFSNESRFSVHSDNRHIFIRRDRGSRNNPAFMYESVRFGSGGVLVYGGISIDGGTDLYIIRDGPLTARRYRDEILRPVVVPYAAAIGDDFILMDDHCWTHRAYLVEDFLFEEGIVRMEWPACSPDMNPIEHVWDALGRRVAGRQPPPQTLQELERALLEERGALIDGSGISIGGHTDPMSYLTLQPLAILFFECRMMPKIIQLILCRTFFEVEQIQSMELQIRSLGPKSYAACLGLIRTTHSTRSLSSLTVRGVEIVLLEECSSIPQSLTDALIASTLNSIAAPMRFVCCSGVTHFGTRFPEQVFRDYFMHNRDTYTSYGCGVQ